MSKVVPVITGAVLGFFTGGPVGAIAGAVAGASQSIAESKRESAQRRQLEEQRKQTALSNAQQEIARSRAIRQSIAQGRVQRATLTARAFESGLGGAGSSITADTSSAVGAANTQQAAATGIANSRDREATFANQARSANGFDTLSSFASLVGVGNRLYNQGAFQDVNASTFSDFGGGAVSGGR